MIDERGGYSNAYTTADLYGGLLRLARKLASADVHYCNGTRFTGEGEHDKEVERIYTKIADRLTEYGLHWYHQGDPRGASLYISKDILDSSNYTNGLAIY